MTKPPSMSARINWAGDLTFIGYGPTEKAVVMDGGKSDGGLGIGNSPLELLLISAGGCAAVDVVMILQKARQKITDVSVEVSGDRAEDFPKRFLNIHQHFTVKGHNLDQSKVKKAVDLAVNKYCSSSQTIAQGAPLTHDFAIVEETN